VNVFREPQLLLFFAEAKVSPEARAVSLLAAADWLDERGGPAELAHALRQVAQAGLHPAPYADGIGYRWLLAGNPEYLPGAGALLPWELFKLLKGENYASVNRNGKYKHYSSYTLALLALTRALARFRRPRPIQPLSP
jgi:hypothetical protein